MVLPFTAELLCVCVCVSQMCLYASMYLRVCVYVFACVRACMCVCRNIVCFYGKGVVVFNAKTADGQE